MMAKGLPQKLATMAQSRPSDPRPMPKRPETICWAVTEFFLIKQIIETVLVEGNKKLGTR